MTRPATRYVALLRGIDVGGTRKLPMAELRTLCAAEGSADIATSIRSGNLVLSSGPSGKERVAVRGDAPWIDPGANVGELLGITSRIEAA